MCSVRISVYVESHDGETEQERYSRKQDPFDSTEELYDMEKEQRRSQGLKMDCGHENQGQGSQIKFY